MPLTRDEREELLAGAPVPFPGPVDDFLTCEICGNPFLRFTSHDCPPENDNPDYGGAFDGFVVTSDADPGL